MNGKITLATATLALLLVTTQTDADESPSDEKKIRAESSWAPDIRGHDAPLKVEKGNFVVVPIPISSPQLDVALVVGAAYFHKQTREQEDVQPASVTGAGAMYSSNGSLAAGLGHQTYWSEDKWRMTAAVGYADLDLVLFSADDSSTGIESDWLIEGSLAMVRLARRLGDSNWYAGLSTRFIDFTQDITVNTQRSHFDIGDETKTVGAGVVIQFDSRDMPTNAYSGHNFAVTSMFNSKSLGSDLTYQSYGVALRSYHKLSAPVVLAWEVAGCKRSGRFPLWDACRIGLRGFPATRYMGDASVRGQFEARWQLSKRWGLVGFAGVGQIHNSLSELRDRETIPSAGVGIRFAVLPAKRINIRVDYGRSKDDDAVYLSVMEAF